MKSENAEIVRYISNASVLVPLLFFLFKFRILPRENKIIGMFVVISAMADWLGYILFTKHLGTSILFNIYTFISFAILCFYYDEVVFKFKNRGYFYLGIAVFVLAFFFISIRQSLFLYQGEMWAITGAILVYFGIVYNNYQVEKPPLFDKNLYSGLIFNAAIMLYFSFNFFLFIIANYVLTELTPDMSRLVWSFHNLNNIIKNIAFAFGFYYTMRRRVNLTDEEVEKIQWRHMH